jgi:hypothetical protein
VDPRQVYQQLALRMRGILTYRQPGNPKPSLFANGGWEPTASTTRVSCRESQEMSLRIGASEFPPPDTCVPQYAYGANGLAHRTPDSVERCLPGQCSGPSNGSCSFARSAIRGAPVNDNSVTVAAVGHGSLPRHKRRSAPRQGSSNCPRTQSCRRGRRESHRADNFGSNRARRYSAMARPHISLNV